MKNVIHIIKSPSFNSDGRLQKWILQLEKRDYNSKVFIIEDENISSVEKFNNTVVVKSNLFSRKYFEKGKGFLIKVLEYFFKVKKYLKKNTYNILVFHDVQQYLNIFYYLIFYKNRNFQIIWDLHELPHDILLKNKFTQKIIKYILNNANAVVYTNNERRDYILSHLKDIKEKQFFILNNFPDKEFINSPKNEIQISELDNKPYFLWLGAGIKGRNFDVFLKAYSFFKNKYNLVVIGKIDKQFDNEIQLLKNEEIIYNRFVNQNEIIRYIDGCFLSVVLYKSTTPNNFYCEPNRLYQLISRKIPVVVGNNPTMKNVIEKLKVGSVLNDDGSTVEELKEQIEALIRDYDNFKNNLEKNNFINLFSWEHQINTVIDSL